MIIEATGRMMATNYIDMSPIFDGLAKQMKSHSKMLQHGSGFLNPSMAPNLFVNPQSVKNAVSMGNSGMKLNISA